VLVDCGLKPGEVAIHDFFMAMQADRNIGGVCGFMGLNVENVYDDAG
jgi:chitin synthase